MEGMVGEVYIDNADENMEDSDAKCEDQVPDEWRRIRDGLILKAGADDAVSRHNWTYAETDVIFLRDYLEVSVNDIKNPGLANAIDVGDILECSWCEEVFLSSKQMARHLLLCHLQWDTSCGSCHKSMNNSVIKHECPHTCADCNKVFKSRHKMMRHMFKMHSKFYCTLCEIVLDSLETYRNHIDEENCKLSKCCILCKSSLDDDSGSCFKDHLLKSHFGPILLNKPTVFEDKTSSNSEIELITHISMKYKPNKTETYLFDNYSCPHCQRKFSAKSGLKIHVGIAHKGGKIIFCSRCPSAFSDVSDCKIHFKEEHSNISRKKTKRKHFEEVTNKESEPHKSMVPTNLPVDGSENNYNIVTNINNNNSDSINDPQIEVKAQEKKKAKKPIPGLVKIQDFATSSNNHDNEVYVNPAPLVPNEITKSNEIFEIKNFQEGKKIILTPKAPTVSTSPMLTTNGTAPGPPPVQLPQFPVPPPMVKHQPQILQSVRPVKTILPNTMAPNNYQVILKNTLVSPPPPKPQQQVYVPAMTAAGTTILLKLEEAQKHLNNGVVTFLPSSSSGGSTQIINMPPTPTPQTVTQHKDEIIPTAGAATTTTKISDDKTPSDIMREKVALNLPVVMTKRTNKKLAQDNPFFKVVRNHGDLEGVCRKCETVFAFKNTAQMVKHYSLEHNQDIQIKSFPLYYEINHKVDKDTGSNVKSTMTLKFFLCHFCGKEFTTKFNVRRHQMLYCVRKDEINPKDLGLGRIPDEEMEESSG